jgi:hypothetical protein
MKYLKLFEAFESRILSKTLGFIKKDKKMFIEQLERVCSSIDFPKSKLSDDFFRYLPFKAALNVSQIIGDEPCDATSQRAFPEHGVEGETCKGGKIKRMWGARQREVACPICGGTGVKAKTPELKLIKFWFSAEGEYIASTAVDGVIRNSISSSRKAELPQNIALYNELGSFPDASTFKTGDIVQAKISGSNIIGYIYKEGSRSYLIQSTSSGSTPSGSAWRSYGRYAWVLSGGEYDGNLKELQIKSKEKIDLAPNPYSWNFGLELRYGRIGINNNVDVQDLIKDAHFAIIMDFGKIKESGFKGVRYIRSEREESREGATALLSDEDIKDQNIERYNKAIADKLTSGDEITNITRSIPKMFGGDLCISYIFTSKNYSTFDALITRLWEFMRETDEDDKISMGNDIVRRLKNFYENNSQLNLRLSSNIDKVKKSLKDDSSPVEQERLLMIDKLSELSKKINEKILKSKVESIDDLENIYQKLQTVSRLLKSSDRGDTYRLVYFYDKLINYDDYNRAINNLPMSSYTNNIISDIERISRLLDRM